MAKIFKSDEVPGGLPDLTPHRLGDIREEARRILEAARERAGAILAEARLQAEQIRKPAQEEARKAGFEAGRQQGLEQGRKEGQAEGARTFAEKSAALTRALEAALRAIEEEKRALLRRGHDELLALAVRIAEKIVGATVARHPDAVRETVARAIELASTRIGVSVRLHPGDVESVRAFLPQLHQRFTDLEPVQLVGDEAVAPGGCVVRTREGEVDATLQTQIDEIARLLLGEGSEGRA